jgi:hypothetical protein
VTDSGAAISASHLLALARDDLASVAEAITGHPVLAGLEAGQAPRRVLETMAAEQRLVIASDRRSFAQLATRHTADPAGAFFLTMAEGEGIALGLLEAHISAVGLDHASLAAYEPLPGCQAYPAFVAWLALNGSRADVALAFLANLAAWGANCARTATALRERYGLDERGTAFFEFFATTPPDFEDHALAVVQAGLAEGEDPLRARRAARLLQAYELQYWDTLGAVH